MIIKEKIGGKNDLADEVGGAECLSPTTSDQNLSSDPYSIYSDDHSMIVRHRPKFKSFKRQDLPQSASATSNIDSISFSRQVKKKPSQILDAN